MPEILKANINGTSYGLGAYTASEQAKVAKADAAVTNAVTESSFADLMDEQNEILMNIAKRLRGLTQWEKIQEMVRKGTFADHYSVGDQLTVKYNGNDTLWDVVAIDVATPADTSKTHSVTLMPHDCLDKLMFDNIEPNNSDSNRQNYGNNRYLYSNIRQWLNSSAAAGSWYTNQHNADAAPNYATTKPGFMSYFDNDFLEVIGKTKIKTVKASVDGGGYEEMTDEYFYLPSRTEMGLGNENNIAEGALFPYFDSNEKRIKNYNGSTASFWWLRTPNPEYSQLVRVVLSSGDRVDGGGLSADIACVVPVCNII